jgi:acyl-CoA synthetase (AMP-forming)/AMP-acid ligase II
VQFNLARAFDTLVETLADRECIVWKDRRLTYRQVAERSRRLGSYLHARGLGVRTEREHLAGHESGQDHLALALYNGNEYLEGMLGSYRARVAPFNVNYRYVGEELRYLLNDANPRALILHASLAPMMAEVLPTLESPPDVLLQVADDSGHDLLPGAVDYEDALAASSPEDAGRGLGRRSLHPLHRRDDRHAQGCAVAPARHLHGRHGRAEGRHLGHPSPATRVSPSGSGQLSH